MAALVGASAVVERVCGIAACDSGRHAGALVLNVPPTPELTAHRHVRGAVDAVTSAAGWSGTVGGVIHCNPRGK